MSADSQRVETFGWQECHDRLSGLLSQHNMVPGANGKHFMSTEAVDDGPVVEFFAPECLPLTHPGQQPAEYLAQLSDELGDHLIVLIQAGAAALGWWSNDDVLYQKVLKAYVVRGRGRAQTLHAKTKGKSRYGSRLRLRKAQQHLIDINERLIAWWDEAGPAERIFFSCPQRTWPELFSTRPAPPFEQRDERLSKIPMHVHVPNADELHRVRRKLLRGRVIYRGEL